MKLLIETNAFDAHSTAEGIIIQQKNKATIKLGIFILLLSMLSYALYYYVPFQNLPRKWLQWIFDPGLHYLSIPAGITGILLILKGVLFKNIKPILFDRHTKELHLRREKIPFREIENLRYMSFPFIGGNVASIKFTHKGLPRTLMNTPAIVKSTSEMDRLVDELSKLVKNSGY